MGDNSKQCVIVTGACGWIGRAVCGWLKVNGYTVIACDLAGQAGPWDHFVAFDISNELGIPPLHALGRFSNQLEGAVLIHCAGYAHRPIETAEEVRRFFAINAEGTARVIAWCQIIGIRRIAYVSSIAFYDWENLQGQLPLTESAAVKGTTAYAQSKLRGEELVRTSGLNFRIVRLATVFGEGDKANFSRLASALKRRRFIVPGSGDARKSVISVRKAAEWIARFALLDAPPKQLINLGFKNAPQLREICEAYVAACGFPRPKTLPLGILSLLTKFGDLVAVIRPSFPLTTTNLRKLTQSTWVDCSHAVDLFPEAAKIAFAEELAKCADYYQELR